MTRVLWIYDTIWEKSKSNNFIILLEKGETSVILIVFKSVLYQSDAIKLLVSW
jgi:hypothetical protein